MVHVFGASVGLAYHRCPQVRNFNSSTNLVWEDDWSGQSGIVVHACSIPVTSTYSQDCPDLGRCICDTMCWGMGRHRGPLRASPDTSPGVTPGPCFCPKGSVICFYFALIVTIFNAYHLYGVLLQSLVQSRTTPSSCFPYSVWEKRGLP